MEAAAINEVEQTSDPVQQQQKNEELGQEETEDRTAPAQGKQSRKAAGRTGTGADCASAAVAVAI